MKNNPYLKPLGISLEENDGRKTLSGTFGENLYLGIGCDNLGECVSPPTSPVEETIYAQIADGTIREIFDGFGVELEKLAHTPAQVCDLAVSHKEKLNFSALILMQARGNFFVVRVGVRDDGSLCAFVYDLASDFVWHTESQRRFVVPQLNTLSD